MKHRGSGENRRTFLQRVIAGTVAGGLQSAFSMGTMSSLQVGSERPWYRKVYRWGQTNINEMDPVRYDLGWWRKHWEATRVQGLVVNAGGIVSYYPSRFPLHYRAQYLGDRDLFGEVVAAARAQGLVVLARMDSNRAHQPFFEAHPEWFARDSEGNPYRAAELYITCINSPYYDEHIPAVLREVVERYAPVGITDNSWSGLGRDQICFCQNCVRKFREFCGEDLPRRGDWRDAVYRQWIRWNYARRTEVWEQNNRATRAAGGEACLWLGMIGGDFISQGRRFRNIPELLSRSEMVMLDDQGRSDEFGFQENAEMGKRLHGLLGWHKLIPESMAMYQRAPTFRKAAAAPEEARMWMVSGFAGGIQPWWHHVGAYQWDRRQFRTAESVCRWHEENQDFLVEREPLASVGVVWSQENADFYGRNDAHERVARPYYGLIQALVRARIPYLPVHADDLERSADGLALLILPNLATLSERQAAAIKQHVQQGGCLLATGESGLYDEWGDRRQDFVFSSLLGVRFKGSTRGTTGTADTWSWNESGSDHTYLRLEPEVGQDVDGPRSGQEPLRSGQRHPVLKGFEETDILAFGGLLQEVEAGEDTTVPLTYIPAFPAYPPETSWMREPRTGIPALVLSEAAGRCAYFAADLDRRFSHDHLPDHGELLANVVRWLLDDRTMLRVDGRGLLDCHLYRKQEKLILHVVNLSHSGSWRAPLHELMPAGPFRVRIQVPDGVRVRRLRFLVQGNQERVGQRRGWVEFPLKSVLDHEVVVLE